MNAKIIRNTAFQLHRWLGLVGGTLLCIAGLTGSVLVFWHEIDELVIAQQFGKIVSGSNRLPIPAFIDQIKTTYSGKGLMLNGIDLSAAATKPYTVWFKDAAEHYLQVFVNPYTGQIMGDRQWETSWVGMTYALHYKLLAGDTGALIMGIVALLTLILSITGIVLWPGWRRLITGFTIRWDAHIQRLNFDIHKVAGVSTAIFLAFIGFTGFAWNIPQAKVQDAIHTVTLTPKQPDPVSKPIPGQQPLALTELLQRADTAFPNARTTYISFTQKPEAPFRVSKKQAQETTTWGGTHIYLDQFSGEVLQISDPLKPSRAEAILNQFGPLHFGTFGGLFTKILYILVGLTPTILMVTGLVMWWHRPKGKGKDKVKDMKESAYRSKI